VPGAASTRPTPGRLLEVLTEVREELGPDPQYVHYLAVPPATFAPLAQALGKHGLTDGARVRRSASDRVGWSAFVRVELGIRVSAWWLGVSLGSEKALVRRG
jgi:hypothetical protein